MKSWISELLSFLPLVASISIVCAAMKEDRIGRILIRGLRFAATLVGLTVGFGGVIYALLLAFH